jgi:hypothetical protein
MKCAVLVDYCSEGLKPAARAICVFCYYNVPPQLRIRTELSTFTSLRMVGRLSSSPGSKKCTSRQQEVQQGEHRRDGTITSK